MNSNGVKRSRNVNFNKREEELLVELVTTHKHVLENKKTDAVMWKEKEACWTKLASEFNSQSLLVPRTVQQLQLKYKNIKKCVRKKSASIRLEHLKTGGGKNEAKALSDAEQKVKDMIQLSIEGMPSQCDCDYEVDAMPPVHEDPNEVDDNFVMFDDDNDDNSYFVTVMPNEFQCDKSSSLTSTNIITKPVMPNEFQCDKSSSLTSTNIITKPGTTISQWDVVTPQNLKSKLSTPLRTPHRKKKSRTVEATRLLQHKDQLTELQIKCLEQEFDINEVKKRTVILEEQKLKLEIELLKQKLQM